MGGDGEVLPFDGAQRRGLMWQPDYDELESTRGYVLDLDDISSAHVSASRVPSIRRTPPPDEDVARELERDGAGLSLYSHGLCSYGL